MFDVLGSIGEKFNNSNIKWAVGASILLSQFGLIDKPNDIDIVVDINDIKKADKILKDMGEKKIFKKPSTYSTKFFYEYVINEIDIDIMAGLAINHDNGIFEYIFDNSSISEFKVINGVKIPFTSLEDWYVIYQLIPNREAKVNMIEKYITSNGIKRCDLLERILEGNLPVEVREKIKNMLLLQSE